MRFENGSIGGGLFIVFSGSHPIHQSHPPSGRVGNAVTGEGKISLIFNFEKHQRKPFSKPKSLAYQRKTYPPRACHLAVTARPSQRAQRESGDIYAYITTSVAIFFFLAFSWLPMVVCPDSAVAEQPPNIVIIFADDLGYLSLIHI